MPRIMIQATPHSTARLATILIAVVFVIGVALRIWGATIPIEPISDFQRYFFVASEFSSTGHLSYRGEPFIFQPPAYPAVLGAVFKVFGSSALIGVLLNLVLSVASLIALHKTLSRLQLKPPILVGTLAVFAIHPGLIAFIPILGSETLSVFLVCSVLLLSTYRGKGAAALLGTLLAALALCRPQYLPVVVAVVAVALWHRNVSGALIITLAFAVVLAPWVARNQAIFGIPVTVSANGGYVAFVNNNSSNTTATWMALSLIKLTPEQYQKFDAVGGAAMFEEGDESEKTFLWTPDIDKVANQEAIGWIVSHPHQFLRLAITRLTNTLKNAGESIFVWWYPNQLPKNRPMGTFTTALTLAVTVMGGIATLFLLTRWTNPTVILAISIFALTFAAIAIFEGQGRYLIPTLPAMLICIALAANRFKSDKAEDSLSAAEAARFF